MTHEFKAPKCKKKFDNQLIDKQLPIPIEIFDQVWWYFFFKFIFTYQNRRNLIKR